MKTFLKLIVSPVIIALTISCGGGGGGDSVATTNTTSSTSTDEFYIVNYEESTLNSPSISSEFTSSFSQESASFKGLVDSSKVLQGEAKANELETSPKFRLALKTGTITGSVSGVYHVVVYGLVNASSRVVVGQYTIDFSQNPVVVTNASSILNTYAQALNSAGTLTSTISVTEKGRVTYGNWSGAISADLNTMLLTNTVDGKMFLLATKQSSFTSSVIEGSNTVISVSQYKDDNSQTTIASSGGTATYENGTNNASASVVHTSTDNKVSIPSGSRTFGLNSSDTSVIELKNGNGDVTELGFISSDNYFVNINPDNPDRPLLSIIFK